MIITNKKKVQKKQKQKQKICRTNMNLTENCFQLLIKAENKSTILILAKRFP